MQPCSNAWPLFKARKAGVTACYVSRQLLSAHIMCLQEYATLLTVQALEQRLAINRAALKEDAASQEGGEGNPEPMQEA